MQFDLSKVVLKRVETKDSSSVDQNIVANEKEMNRRMRESDVDFWYDSIKELTYETIFIPITPNEARAMAAHYKARLDETPLAPEFQQSLDLVQQRVAQGMEIFGSDGVFVKLASRSPKDATNRSAAASKVLKILLEEREKTGKKPTPDEIINIVFQAHISSFRLFTAKEVMETLLHSNRVITDEIPLVLDHLNEWKEQIVLRRWTDVPVWFEMRGFVFDGKLTSLTQYYNEVICQEVIDNKDKIEKLVRDISEIIIDKIPITPREYCIDFLVDLKNSKVMVVEINPFGKPDGMGTGCVLFDPEKSDDYNVLFGISPFEFRIETEPTCVNDFELMVATAQRSSQNHWARSSLLCELPHFDF
jgi:hypothetical protein